jgi:aminopeptidase
VTFDDQLVRFATLCVTAGIDLRKGQELIISAPIEAQSFVGHAAAAAYRAGAPLVTCLYEDPALIRARFDHGGDEALDRAAGWLSDGVVKAYEAGAARLFVYGPYPDLLTGVAPEPIGRMHAAIVAASAAEGAFTADLRVNWCAVPFVTQSWARMVYPALPIAQATDKLWDDVFDVVRLKSSDPVAAWRDHLEVLEARRQRLQALNLSALHFVGGGTDLMVGLAEAHQWVGGRSRAANGALPVCNFPTEEVFTCPHRDRIEGKLVASRPLALGGIVIEGLVVTFHGGVAERIEARKGQEMLEGLLSGDAGARRLGEVGLVPCSSPVARKDVLFYNTLLDENAANHIAFGQSYSACIEAGRDREAAGANASALHIDCMIGHDAMDVAGILKSGERRAIMRAGDFVLD